MKKHHYDIRGINYSQHSLEHAEHDFQNVLAGQLPIYRYLIILFTNCLLLISAWLAGMLGGIASTSFFIDEKDGIWIFLSVNLTVIIWLTETIRINFAQGMLRASWSILFSSLMSFIFNQLQIISPILFFSILAVGTAAVSLISSSLASALIIILFDQTKRYVKNIYFLQTGFFIFVSFLIAYLYGISVQDKINVNFIVIISSIGGFLSGAVFITASLLTSHFSEKYFPHFQFLRSWAIALSCWHSTSFYNLDLSNVNFRGTKLANTDLRAKKLYRTSFQDTKGLERARIDSRYLDLEIPKVQKLLTKPQDYLQDYPQDKDFSNLNLRGAFLQNVKIHCFNFTDSDLSGADMQSADLYGAIFVRTQVIGVDFTDANLTGICIEDWSVNSQTQFKNVTCDFVYRRLDENGNPSDKFPLNRNFEPREFESLYQEVENVIEIIFQEGENWQAALYSLIKLQMEDEQLELKLKGVEKRGDVWVVKVTYNEAYAKQEVEHRLNATVEEMKYQLAAKEQQIYHLEQEKYKILEIAGYQAKAIEGLSSRIPLNTSNNFFISGSNITNLAGSGQIEYAEAAAQVRSIIANSADSEQATAVLHNFLAKLQRQSVATNIETQADLMQQMILAEAQKDAILKQLLIHQEQQIIAAFGEGLLARAIQSAIAQLKS
ncbi:pentapeptide repeat-containing protein [Calothrix sp. FACHB-1219]|uniref:pentapeptide repeat-containing protein n=1 Tax=unclassified Calothrix TaxID=2619626 RepID=UPI001685EE30|nr:MULTISPECIES: pentapeptide repeat-containing protein [unclassified Calothrix]MBD2200958.1 pentapeptide repeat-containing protein [Calothrix sp. FACHB-168]MBD2219764.1 pentapeptide repeat-containing protein [Calothrix sp. FACHB-1219]